MTTITPLPPPVIGYLREKLQAAGPQSWPFITEQTGLAPSFLQKFMYGTRENPRIGTLQPLLTYFQQLELYEQQKDKLPPRPELPPELLRMRGAQVKPSDTGQPATLAFKLKAVWASEPARRLLEEHDVSYKPLVLRHAMCDWGDVPPFIKEANYSGLLYNSPLVSVFRLVEAPPNANYIARNKLPSVWVLTPGDRSITYILLPTEHLLDSMPKEDPAA